MPVTLAGENVVGPEDRVFELTETQHRYVFTGIAEEPTLSFARSSCTASPTRSP